MLPFIRFVYLFIIKSNNLFLLQAKLNQSIFGLHSIKRKRKCSTNSNSSMSTSSNTSLSCTGCLNCCCKNNKYEISKEAMKEIAAFGTFLEQFHQKQQQNATKTSQDTNHQLTKNASPETVSDE